MLDFYHLPPASGGRPGHVVVFLHGLGDSGRGGMLSIGAAWQNDLPDTEFICPDAPFPLDGAPPEMTDARQWFTLREFTFPEMQAGVRIAAPCLDQFLDHVLETRAIGPDKLALVGFSQGTIMALYVAPRRAKPVAGILGYAGVLIGGETLGKEKKSAPPVLLIHGTADEVVPYGLLALSEEGLKKAGIPVETATRPGLTHGIDNPALAEGLKFLKKILV